MTAPEFSDAEMIAEITSLALGREGLTFDGFLSGEEAATVNKQARLYRAIAARLSAASGDWQPPPEAERPDGFRCLGWVPGWCDENDSGAYVWKDTPFWCGVTWRDAPDLDAPPAWVSDFGDAIEPVAFAPLPPPPTQR